MNNGIPKVLAELLEPLVQLERAKNWADAHDERFFEVSYHADGDRAWEACLYVDIELGKLLDVDFPRCIRSEGPTLPEALESALDKVVPS